MKTYSLIAIILALAERVSCWNLRVDLICEAGDPSGTNHTVVFADTFLGCTSACDFNTNCYYLSFLDNDCVMYEDVSPCGMNGGPTRDVYKVDPRCEPGWHRFSGSCYLVIPTPGGWWTFRYGVCQSSGTYMVAVSSEREGIFLGELLHSLGLYDTMIWTGGNLVAGVWGWATSPESMVYQNWRDGEPQGGACVSLNSTDAKWQSDVCGAVIGIGVCEKPLF